MKHMTVEEFIRETRPDGLGHIKIDDTEDISFSEVICDLCNAEITSPEDEPEKKCVHLDDWGAYCDSCFKTMEERK